MCGKGLAGALFIALFLGQVPGPINVSAENKVSYQWIQNDVAIDDYEDIYIYQLDLRGMIVEVRDDKEKGIGEESIDSSALENIAKDLYQKFAWSLDGILPINKNQNIDKTRKSLVVKVKISGRFPYEDRGVLVEKLVDSVEQKMSIDFACRVYDAGTEKDVLIINDTQESARKGKGEPLTSDEDMAKLSEILGFWARSFAEILSEKKEL